MNNTALILVNTGCNNRCLICMREEIKSLPVRSLDDIKAKIKEVKEQGYANLSLSGGEASIRPDILEIIRFAESLGFDKITLKTNGRRLSARDFAEALSKIKNFEIIFSMNGHTAPIHESVTGVEGSFKETVKGMMNAKEFGIPAKVNVVVCRPNYQHLSELADFLVGMGIFDMQFCFIHPSGEAMNHLEEMVPKIEDTSPYLNAVLAKNESSAEKTGQSVHALRSIAYPFCLLEEKNRKYAIEHTGDESETFSKTKLGECRGCRYLSVCPGIWSSYARLYGFVPKPVK